MPMKPFPILNASRGLDVLAAETELPEGHVRAAENVTINDGGGIERRAGYTLDLALAEADSLFSARQRELVLVKAGSTLYRLTGVVGALTATSIATGLWAPPAAYAELAGSVYVSAGKWL